MINVLTALFCALSYGCPAEFRHQYGAAMRFDFRDAVRDELRAHGPRSTLFFAIGAYADLCTTALREYVAMIFRDLVFAFRSLRKTPLFAMTVIATLALAIGANATVFSILRAVVLAPLPYPHAERLVALSGTLDGAKFGFSLPDFVDLRDRSRTVATMAAYTSDNLTLSGRGEPRKLTGMITTRGLFETLGAVPEFGRFFSANDVRAGAPKEIVVADRLWRTVLHADPSAVGQVLLMDGVAYRIIGVAPPGFAQPNAAGGFARTEYWIVLTAAAAADPQYARGAHYFSAVGRLRDGISLAAARFDLDTIFRRLIERYPDTDLRFGVRVESLVDALIGNVRPTLFAIFGAVAGVLLVACANVANLLLSRAATRDRELAVRLAIGASHGRIVMQLLTETFAITLAGGVIGMFGAMLSLRGFIAIHPPGVPRIEDVTFDGVSALFTLGVIAFCTLAAGLAPAFTLARRDVVVALKAAGRSGDSSSGRRARSGLAVAEIALTLALVIAAALIVRSFFTLTAAPLGFDPTNVSVVGLIDLPDRRYPNSVRQAAYYERAIQRVRAIPGVSAAAWGCCGPFMHENFSLAFDIVGRKTPVGDDPSALANLIGTDYFTVLGIPLIRGRAFVATDRAGSADVVIVNTAFARQYFPGGSPIGARITWGGGTGRPGHPLPQRTIVGVAGAARDTFARPQQPMLYLPIAQSPPSSAALFVRATDPTVVSAAAAATTLIDRDLPPPAIETMSAKLDKDAARAKLVAMTLGALAVIALLLSVAGIFAIVSYGVTQRTHEFGIRMALGARSSHIVRGVVGSAMRMAIAGIVLGLACAAFSTRFLSDQLYDTAPLDPLTFGAVTLLIAVAILVASLLPARRATRVDPVIALRYE